VHIALFDLRVRACGNGDPEYECEPAHENLLLVIVGRSY
jgi:hypothetical protein